MYLFFLFSERDKGDKSIQENGFPCFLNLGIYMIVFSTDQKHSWGKMQFNSIQFKSMSLFSKMNRQSYKTSHMKARDRGIIQSEQEKRNMQLTSTQKSRLGGTAFTIHVPFFPTWTNSHRQFPPEKMQQENFHHNNPQPRQFPPHDNLFSIYT